MKFTAVIVCSFICLSYAVADELNDEIRSTEQNKSVFRTLVRPFRMEKLNMMWIKAQQVSFCFYLWPAFLLLFLSHWT